MLYEVITNVSHPPLLESIEAKDFIAPFPDRNAPQGAEAVGGLLSHGPLRVSVVKKWYHGANLFSSGEGFPAWRTIVV